jgi:DNA-binding CsgD family transcriptional regulator
MTGQLASTTGPRVERLSDKERACLRLVARHLSSRQIALELGIAKTSVDTYCDRARAKLGVADRYEAARLLQAELGPLAPMAGGEQTREIRLFGAGSNARPAMLGAAFAAAVLIALVILLAGLRAVDSMKPAHMTYQPSPHDLAMARLHAR